jgi:hypothetical protein
MARRVWPLCLFLAHTCAARHTGYALRGTRGFSGLEMLVTGWMGVLQLDPLLFVSIVAAWVCTCAPDRREEACSASYGRQVTTTAKWRVCGRDLGFLRYRCISDIA